MNRDEYTRMHALEARLWWYRGLHAHLLAALPSRAGRLLDAGCGTGGFLTRLKRERPDLASTGIDIEPFAAGLARAGSGGSIAAASVSALPFADRSFDVIVSADVLYHARVDEAAALGEFRRCLAPGGVLVVNLPAYEWLRGAHDRAVHGARRYTSGRVVALLRAAGFAEARASYWNSFLFPLMVARRKLGSSDASESDVMLLPAPVEALFRGIVAFEAFLFRRGIRLPFGGSVLGVGVAP